MDSSRAAWAPIPLRLILGWGFLYHGYSKLFTAKGYAGLHSMMEQSGIPAPGVVSWLVGVMEFAGGIALLLGAVVSLTSLLLSAVMLVAIFQVHLPAGFNFMNIIGMTDSGPVYGMPGYEVNLLYIAGLLALALMGAGAVSVDGVLRRRRKEAQQTVIRAEPARERVEWS